MNNEFKRVAIVNRGEAAMRFIHAAREFNQENNASLCTIALFSEPDCHAMFVREADEAVFLGPAQTIDRSTQQLKSVYVEYGRLAHALSEARADAVWVGWGFVAEHAAFADLCRDMGIVFIGPEGDVMRRLGDKIASKRLAEEAQIPVAPWSGGSVETLADAADCAARMGFPLLIKATAGGGGHGIRLVRSSAQLEKVFEGARREAFKAFGDPTVFMERLIEGARHVEVQIIADHYGTTWAAGVRDCTIQRRHQKVVEEAPSPVLSARQDRAMREGAVRLSEEAGYHNAGTVEFLYQPETKKFWFMEMNTRLQVEHPVTECTTGLDLVKLQIHVARGGRLEGRPPRTRGHAIEVRLNAEDPENGFAPAPGVVERFRILTGPGVRVDTGVAEGETIPAEFDSMIAKIIAWGRDRREAISRLRRALSESVVVIKGGASNRAFLLDLLSREEVQAGSAHVLWLDELASRGRHLSQSGAEVALIQAAIHAYDADLAVEQAQFYASAARGRPHVQTEIGRTVSLRYRGNSYAFRVQRLGPRDYRVELDGTAIDVVTERLGRFEHWLTISGQRFSIVSVEQGVHYRIEVNGVSHRIDRDDGGVVHALAPAVVASITVKAGDIVSAGDRVAVLEAMKMEMEVVAPFSGTVRQVMVIPNVQVDTGAALVQIDPAAAGAETSAASERVVLTAFPVAGRQEDLSATYIRSLKDLRQLMLGFDVDPQRRLPAERSKPCESGEDEEVREKEDEILRIFVDICSLFQRQPGTEDASGGEIPSAEIHLFAYLRMLETRGEGLPPAFVEALQRVLAHYGVRSLERSADLEESLVWIYKSHQRIEQHLEPVVSLLERRRAKVEALEQGAQESFRTLLDRMISMTQGVFPAVCSLAREVRYRYFDRPLFEGARRQIYDQVSDHLAYLAAHPNAADRRERMRALVECPQPLMSFFAGRFAKADLVLRQLMLEVLVSRYYRTEMLMNLTSRMVNEQWVVSAEYEDTGKRVHLFATYGEHSRLSEVAEVLFPLIKEVPEDHDVVLDLYAWQASQVSDAEAAQAGICGVLNQVEFPRTVRRIVTAAGVLSGRAGVAGMQHFTFRRNDSGYEEDKLYRGIHPMMAKRLRLWRLSNFKIERLPSAEDVYLLRGVAKDNPKDERLFAVAEVRDLTPVLDKSGRIVQLPHLERMFAEALAGIRLFQARRRVHERLHWNRMLLHVWPPLRLKPDEFQNIVQRLFPETEGLGLEQVVVVRIPNPETGELREMVVRISSPGDRGLLMTFRPATKLQPLKPLTEYDQKVVRMRQRGFIYPYEIIKMLTPGPQDTRAEFPAGEFVEYDLDQEGNPVPVERPHGQNKSNIILGVIRNFTSRYPEGMSRVLVMGDPSKDLGAIAEPECRRILAGLKLAGTMRVPLEWFAISAGAKISMQSGVENMDWIARVLRGLVEFTQAGGEVNLIINGINVGAQPYWNAEATMLMHTRGILIMTPKAAMVLTGKRALDYSGSVSAEDNQGIGGYDRIMGLNGQAQYWARDIDEACRILLRHYEHTYLAPGERFPRRAETTDPFERDVQDYPHCKSGEEGFGRVGEILSEESNPGRKKPFDIRKVMMAAIDQDHPPLERWSGMRAAEIAVVWDAHLGGYPVCLIGIESRPVQRLGFVPADGPDQWTAGTLFPLSSKKVARAINAASNNRPVVLLANLSGFDGSPESMRRLQLEYGAEIGRAVVNFKGPMVFCVISRYHGGAYVVFSRALNKDLEVAALEGTYASVIGGAPAAAVVFAGEVDARTRKDPRLQELAQAIAQRGSVEKTKLAAEWNELFQLVYSEKLGEVAAEFDRIHSVERALRVGALHTIIPPANLRPYLIDAVTRGISRHEAAKTEKPEGESQETEEVAA